MPSSVKDQAAGPKDMPICLKAGRPGAQVPGTTREAAQGALIRDLNVDQPDDGQRVSILNQGRDALIQDRSVGHKRTLDSE
jgi:hypothetical protein